MDANRDGVQDDGEPVLPGVTVTLTDADGNSVTDVYGDPVAPATTDENGRYLFDNLPAGDYRVQFTLTDEQAATYLFTDAVAGDDATVDSDAGVDGQSAVFTLDGSNAALTTDYTDQDVAATEGIDPTWDAGVVQRSYAVGDYTWVDTNRDGVQDAEESVLAGVTVTLTDADGNPVTDVYGDPVAPTTTDSDGHYLFDNLPAGDYQVHFTLTDEQAQQYVFTGKNIGNEASSNDSDADTATGATDVFTLDGSNAALTTDYTDQAYAATEGIDPTWDAGVNLKSVSVGDYVWVDSNRDGVQDPDEPGIEGVTLCLVGPDGEPVTDVFGNPVGPVVTDSEGRYSFDNLPALSDDQTYTVCIDRDASAQALAPYVPTQPDAGDDDGADSSTWQASTEPGELHRDGDRDPTLDFGFVTKSYAVGDYVWIDSNADGVQGDDEPVLPGVTVELLDGDGNVVATTTTDAQGRYLFDALPAGTYQVRFTLTDEQAATYQFTAVNAGGDAAADSDADPATGLSAPFVLDDSNAALTVDYDRDIAATQGIDPTWDAGVVLQPDDTTIDTDPTSEVDPTSSGGDLSYTGVAYGIGAVVAALALLLGGAALLLAGRRRAHRH